MSNTLSTVCYSSEAVKKLSIVRGTIGTKLFIYFLGRLRFDGMGMSHGVTGFLANAKARKLLSESLSVPIN